MKRLLLVLTAALALLATSCGSNGAGSGTVAARINGTTISLEQLTDELEQIVLVAYGPSESLTEDQWANVHGENMPVTNFTNSLTVSVLTSIVNAQLVSDELAERGIVVSDDEVAAAAAQIDQQLAMQEQQGMGGGEISEEFRDTLARRQAEQAALSEVLVSEDAGPLVTDEEVRAYYDENIDQVIANNGDLACISLLVVGWTEGQDPEAEIITPTPEQEADSLARAEAIVDELERGADFAQVAREKSAVPSTAESGGDYGCLAEQQQSGLPEVQAAAFAQEIGVVGAPVRTDYGHVIVKVRSRGVPPFEDVEAAIRGQLEQVATESADPFSDWLRSLHLDPDVDVWVNPQIGTWADEVDPTTRQHILPPEGAAVQALPPSALLGEDQMFDLSQLSTGG